jgi:hypothetical protein
VSPTAATLPPVVATGWPEATAAVCPEDPWAPGVSVIRGCPALAANAAPFALDAASILSTTLAPKNSQNAPKALAGSTSAALHRTWGAAGGEAAGVRSGRKEGEPGEIAVMTTEPLVGATWSAAQDENDRRLVELVRGLES